MAIEIKVPPLGESVVEATIAKWYKNKGDIVEVDEPILELETDKVTLEVPSPSSGEITNILHNEGDVVEVDAVLGSIDDTIKISKSVNDPKSESATAKELSKIEGEKITRFFSFFRLDFIFNIF